MAQALRGRDRERAALDRLLDEVRAGDSRVLVLRGEAGVGKTVLLDYVQERAPDCRVVRAAGVESEMELAFAVLHQLCAPLLNRLERLPDPQSDALSTAFGLGTGVAADRYTVSLAVLGLLSEVAEEQPLVCLVDDAQWLDQASAQALAFVARRLLAESVAMVFSLREPGEDQDLSGLSELAVTGLSDADARAVLESVVPGRLDERVQDRIVAETRGNPLALVELTRGLTAAELAGGFGRPDTRPLANRLEQSFHRQLRSLPDETQLLLLTAAAEPVGDAALLRRASEQLGISASAALPAESSGLIEFGPQVRFRHPLVRAAAYRAASSPDRRRVHTALAEVTDPDADPGRRAWHRAYAAVGPEESVAGELERSASQAQARGGVAAAAAFLERATELTPDPARRAARALAAAQAKFEAAAPDTAGELLSVAELGPLNELQRAQAARLRAQIVFRRSRGSDAPALFLEAARAFEGRDDGLARETYLERLRRSMVAVVAAVTVWDEERWHVIEARALQSCREAGLLAPLVIYVNSITIFTVWHGDFAEAASLIAEAEAIAAATGTLFPPFGAMFLAGFRGAEAEAAPLIEAVSTAAQAAGQGLAVQWSQWVAAILHNGLGRYEMALAEAQAAEQSAELHVSTWALPELIEAATRTGQTELAAEALGRLAKATIVGQTDWGQGIYARSRALLSDGADADRWYREAVDRLGRTGFRPELARAHLLYGEWLRRERWQAEARTQLRTAHDMLAAIGMQAFAERARRELRATGETVRARTADPRDQLTPQEAQIARLAGAGLSNPEIAAQLFLSPRTVEYHLAKVFAKLDITSRRQLRQAVPDGGHDGPMA